MMVEKMELVAWNYCSELVYLLKTVQDFVSGRLNWNLGGRWKGRLLDGKNYFHPHCTHAFTRVWCGL